jgi:2'-5' RNA ligase
VSKRNFDKVAQRLLHWLVSGRLLKLRFNTPKNLPYNAGLKNWRNIVLKRDVRLGFYLIPPANLSLKMLELRNLVYDQYRLNAAAKFMTHMTIKGFFKPALIKPYHELIQALDEVVSRYEPFIIYPTRLRVFDDAGVGVEFSKEHNEILWDIHNDCYTVIEPFIAPDCDFTPVELLGENFIPHLTIAMIDVSHAISEEIHYYLSEIEFDNRGYLIENFKLYEFTSQEWSTKEWIYSLQWNILHSWRLNS